MNKLNKRRARSVHWNLQRIAERLKINKIKRYIMFLGWKTQYSGCQFPQIDL